MHPPWKREQSLIYFIP